MSVSSKNKRDFEFFETLLEQTSERSDNFAYNKERGLLLFGRGVNATRTKIVPASLGNGETKPEEEDIE